MLEDSILTCPGPATGDKCVREEGNLSEFSSSYYPNLAVNCQIFLIVGIYSADTSKVVATVFEKRK